MKNLFLFICIFLSFNSNAQSYRERLDDIEDKLDSLMLQRQYDALDKLIEGNSRLRENSSPREIDILLSRSYCNVGFIDGKFQKFTPQVESINSTISWGWTAVSPSKTTSLIFLKNSLLVGLSETEKMQFARLLIERHLNAIRKLCPNIPANLLAK
jgi:hypothetical protein